MRESRVIGLVAEVLVVVFRRGDHRVVYHDSGYGHVAGIYGAGRHNAFDLSDDYASAALCGVGEGELVYDCRLLLQGDVAVLVYGRAANDRHIYGKSLVPKVLLASERDHLDEVLCGELVALAALKARVDKGAESGLGDHAGAAGADLAVELAERTLRKQIGLDLSGVDLCLQRGSEVIVAGDDALEHTDVSEMAHAPVLAVPDPGRMRHSQTAGVTAGEKAVLHGLEQVFRAGRAHEAGYAHGGAVFDLGYGLLYVN